MTEWRVVNWSLKYLGMQRLEARSSVGGHFLIVNSVGVFRCMEKALVASIAKVEGVVKEKFYGAPPKPRPILSRQ